MDRIIQHRSKAQFASKPSRTISAIADQVESCIRQVKTALPHAREAKSGAFQDLVKAQRLLEGAEGVLRDAEMTAANEGR